MNGTENSTAIINMREITIEPKEDFLSKLHENQVKFRIGDTPVHATTTFDEITFVYDDVLISCNYDSLQTILTTTSSALNNTETPHE